MGTLVEARSTSVSVQFIGTDGHGAKRIVIAHKNECAPIIYDWLKVQVECGKPASYIYSQVKRAIAERKLVVKQTSPQYWRLFAKA